MGIKHELEEMEHEFPFGTFHPKTQGALSSQQNFRIEFSKFYVEVMSYYSLLTDLSS